MRAQLFPVPRPADWDITFLTFLCRSRVLQFPPDKQRAADALRICRNRLSHDVKAKVDENEFEEIWRSVSDCLLSLTDDPQWLRNEIQRVKSLSVEVQHLQQQQQQLMQQQQP